MRRQEAKAYANISAAAAADAAAATPPRAKMARAPPKLELPSGHGVLSSIRLADVLGESPHAVVRLAHTQTIADALSILAQHNILSAPGAPLRRRAGAARAVPRARAAACGWGFRAGEATRQRAPLRATARERNRRSSLRPPPHLAVGSVLAGRPCSARLSAPLRAQAAPTLTAACLAARAVVVHTSGAGSPSSGMSDDETAQTETLIGWADVQDILRDFIVPNTPRLAQLTRWDAAIEAVAQSFCSRRLLVVTGEDGGLLPQVNAEMSLQEAVTSGFLSVGGAGEYTLTPRSRGAEAEVGDAYESGGGVPPTRAVHRLALFAGGKIRSIVSQSDVMRFLYHHSEQLGAVARETVDALGFAPAGKQVLCVAPDTPAFAAFNLMYANSLSAVGIVDASEALVGTLSASDVRRLQPHTFSTLVLPVTDFLSAQAPAAQAGLRPPLAVSPSTPFLRVLELLGGSPRIHRVYITDVRGRPVGVVRACVPSRLTRCADAALAQITPTDVLRYLVARDSS